jgi:hypothetical protein
MRQVPDNHYVWKYSDLTRTYYVLGLDENKHGENPLELILRPQTNKTLLHQFIDWYEKKLMVTYELRKTIPQALLNSPEKSTEAESSSTMIESSSSEPITWGTNHVRDHEAEWKQWQETGTREIPKDTTSGIESTSVVLEIPSVTLFDEITTEQKDASQYDRPHSSTFLRFYSKEPDYLNPSTNQVGTTTATGRATNQKKDTRDRAIR